MKTDKKKKQENETPNEVGEEAKELEESEQSALDWIRDNIWRHINETR